MGDKEFIKMIWDRCDPKNDLDVSQILERPLYEPLYDTNTYPDTEDKVHNLKQTITLEDAESCQFFSGFRGSGKTTELKRLRNELSQEDYIVLYTSVLDYIDENEPLDITYMLLVIAGAFGDSVTDYTKTNMTTYSYWDRFVNFMKSEIELKEVSAKAEYSGWEGIKVGADVKVALKSNASFRGLLQGILKNRIEALEQDVKAFLGEGVALLKKQKPDCAGRIVFLVDEFEKIRGGSDNEEEVIQSVRHTFEHSLDRLELPFLHVVYTVPAWLGMALTKACHVEKLPCLRLWDRTSQRETYAPGLRAARSLMERRFRFVTPENPAGSGSANLRRAFGAPTDEGGFVLLDRLIFASGGHFRDLLRLTRDTLKFARSLPVDEAVIKRVLRNYKQDFLPIAVDDAQWLDRIARTQNYNLPNNDPKSVLQFNRFLDRQLVLFLTNGDEWFDVHPLLREEVARIVAEEAAERARLSPAAGS